MKIVSDITHHVRELGLSTRKLAILGAALKLRSSGAPDPAIRKQIEVGSDIVFGTLLSDLSDGDVDSLLVMIEMIFAESGDLFQHPDRAATWNVEDPNLLLALGRASSEVFDRIVALAEQRPHLSACLTGRFLDVGTGVGGIALRAAQLCPDIQIDAIDIWEPALSLAKEAISQSEHAQRISLSKLDVTALTAEPCYSLVWLPTMYMKREMLSDAVKHVVAASQPGAWVIAAVYTQPEDPFSAAMSNLRTLRGGGDIMEASEIVQLLDMYGFIDLEIDRAPLATFILGRLP